MTSRLPYEECVSLPVHPSPNTVYRLKPNQPDADYYRERTDRNIGWITSEEQHMLSKLVVCIAGCGGMGGLLAQIFVRAGVGEVRIADPEEFDISNINRQFGAMRHTVGHSKAFVTAARIREISDDTTLVVYPQGIAPDTVDHFLEGAHIVCDEVEFWAVGARILLHQRARAKGITLLNCNTVGQRTYGFRFTPTSMHVEEPLELSCEEAMELQEAIARKHAAPDQIRQVMEAVIRTFMPEVPEYSLEPETYSTVEAFYRRLFKEGKGPIISTNPPMASGFMANRVLLELLRTSGVQRKFVEIPEMAGYLSFDAALMQTSCVTQKWW